VRCRVDEAVCASATLLCLGYVHDTPQSAVPLLANLRQHATRKAAEIDPCNRCRKNCEGFGCVRQERFDIVEIIDNEHAMIGAILIDRRMLPEFLHPGGVDTDEPNRAIKEILDRRVRELSTAPHIWFGVIAEFV
jgi:hypothetical protein